MKKIFKYGLLFISLATLAACEGNSSSTTVDTSNTEIVETTGYDILYPYTMVVGESDVISFVLYGTNAEGEKVSDGRATFASETPEIISVDEGGRIKALATGEGLITVTSIPFPEIALDCEITVEPNKSETITLFADTNDDVELVGEKQYSAPIGQTITLNYKLDSDDCSTPDNILYSVVDESGAYSGLVDVSKNSDGSGSLLFYSALSNVPIKITAAYQDGIGTTLSDTIFVTSYDKSVEIFEDINNVVDALDESSLISADLKIYNSADTYDTYEFAAYDSASTITSGSNEKTINALDKNVNRYYLFSLDETGAVDSVTKNESYAVSDEATYISYATAYTREVSGETLYGFKNLLNYIINNDTFGELHGFNYYAAKAYLNFTSSDNGDETNIEITSQFEEDGITSIFLTFSYNNNNNTLLSYKYIYKNDVTYYSEEGTNFSYGEKVAPTTNLVSDYYIEAFDVDCIAGEEAAIDGMYDFSDTALFGYESMTSVDGVPHYQMYYSKSLPLQIVPTSPASASLKIDILTIQGNSLNGSRSFVCSESGLVIISGVKDNETGSMIEIEETISFTTLHGIQKSIVIEFIAPEIDAVTLSDGNANIQNNTFPQMFKNTVSGYFYLTSNPDDTNFVFAMKIISGEEDGLAFKKWESNNIYGYPNFSYSLVANKTGTYEFAFYVTANEEVLSQTYSVTIVEPYSADYIASSIVGESYIYSTGQTDFTITITNTNSITLTQLNSYGSEIVTTFNYEISEGKLTTTGNYQELGSGCYFSHIKGDIIFSSDFSYLRLYLAIADSLAEDIEDLYFQWYTFNKVVASDDLLDNINGKTYSTSVFINGYTMSTISITFNNGNGQLTMSNSNGVYATFTFSYTYQEGTYSDTFTFSNVISTDGFSFQHSDQDYYSSSSTLQVWIITPYSSSGQRVDFILN